MTWLYKGNEVSLADLEGAVGFVYMITNLTNGRKYVGKKLLKFSRKRKVKGRSRRVVIDSDWQKYYGSSEELNEDVNRLGAHNFKRDILYFCRSKTEMSYWEAYEQFVRGVLLSDDFYNVWITCKIRKTKALSEVKNV